MNFLANIKNDKLFIANSNNFEIWKRSIESEEILSNIMNTSVLVYGSYKFFSEIDLWKSWVGVFSGPIDIIEEETRVVMEMDNISYNEARDKAKKLIYEEKEKFQNLTVNDCFLKVREMKNPLISENGDWSGEGLIISLDGGESFFEMSNSEWADFSKIENKKNSKK